MKKRILAVLGAAALMAGTVVAGGNRQTVNAEEVMMLPVNQNVSLEKGKYVLSVPSCSKVVFSDGWHGGLDLEDYEKLQNWDWEDDEYWDNDDYDEHDTIIDSLYSTTSVRLPAGEYPVWLDEDLKNARVNIIEESSDKYEQEYNNSFDAANEIETNKEYIGNINWFVMDDWESRAGEDRDYFHFTLPQPGSVSIDSSGTEYVLYREDSATRNTEEIKNASKYRLSAGSYFLVISDTRTSDDYKFKVNYFAEADGNFEQETNDTVETANQIQLNTAYTGNISTPEDKDYFVADVAEKGVLSLNTEIKRQSSSRFTFELLAGEKILDRVKTNSNPTSIGNSIEVNPGKYYIKVSSDSYNGEDYNVTLKFAKKEEVKQEQSEKPGQTVPEKTNNEDEAAWDPNSDEWEDTSDDCTLDSIEKTSGKWNHKFKSSRTEYVLTLGSQTSKVALAPVTSDEGATFTINGNKWKGIQLKIGKGKTKVVKIKVTAENGDTEVYSVMVKRKK